MVKVSGGIQQMVEALILIAVGLLLLPVLALFTADAQANQTVIDAGFGITTLLGLMPFLAAAGLIIGGVVHLIGAFKR